MSWLDETLRDIAELGTFAGVLGGAAAGALAGTRHVTGRLLDALTSAACVAHLPGTAARSAAIASSPTRDRSSDQPLSEGSRDC